MVMTENIIKKLAEEKVNIKNIQVDEKSSTDISVIVVDSESGERTILVNRDVGEKLKINSNIFKNYEWCYVGSLYGNDLEYNVEIINDVVKDNSNLKLVYNPGGSNINNNLEDVKSLLFHASLIFVNKSEACRIAKIFDENVSDDILNSEEKLVELIYKYVGDVIVVLTNGNKGAWGFAGEKIYYENPSEAEILDTTGAGDAFSSGFFSAIIHGYDIEIAMKWGMKNSHNVIRFYGAHEGLLNYDDLKGIC